jgi:uncharacterized repeat protein (TIGR01451 family)
VDALGTCLGGVPSGVKIGPLGKGTYKISIVDGCYIWGWDTAVCAGGALYGTATQVYQDCGGGPVYVGQFGIGGAWQTSATYCDCAAALAAGKLYPRTFSVPGPACFIYVRIADDQYKCPDNSLSILARLDCLSSGEPTPVPIPTKSASGSAVALNVMASNGVPASGSITVNRSGLFDLQVSAVNNQGQVSGDFRDTVALAFQPAVDGYLPAPETFSQDDAGVKLYQQQAFIRQSGIYRVVATDLQNTSINGVSNLIVVEDLFATQTAGATPSWTPTIEPTLSPTTSPTPYVAPVLWVKKTVNLATANPGDILVYTINFGTSGGPVDNVQLSDPLPQFSSFISAPPDPTLLAKINSAPALGDTSGTIVWDVPHLNAGQSGQVQFTVKVDDDINNPTITSPGSGNGLPGGVLFHADFTAPDYLPGENPSLRAPGVWETSSPLRYTIKADPRDPAQEMCLVGDGEPGGGGSPHNLRTVARFQGTTSMDIVAIASSSAIQEYIQLGYAAIYFNGSLLQVFPEGVAANQFAFGYWNYPLNHYLRFHLVYDPTYGCVDVKVHDDTDDKDLGEGGHGCGGSYNPSYDLDMYDNQDSNALYFNHPIIYRGVFNTCYLQALGSGIGAVLDCAGTSINYIPPPFQTPLPTRVQTASPTPTETPVDTLTFTPTLTTTPGSGGDMLAARVGRDERPAVINLLPPGKVLASFPNPVLDSATAVFRLDEDSKVGLILVDLSGQPVKGLQLGNLGKGEHQAALGINGLAPGIYYLVLQTDSGFGMKTRAVFKLAKIR